MSLMTECILLATYLVQALQVFWIKVPSAGSTIEMIRNAGENQQAYHNHPAREVSASKLSKAIMMSASAFTMAIFFLPLVSLLLPGIKDYLGPLRPHHPGLWRLAGTLLLVFGNLLSTAAACTLKKRVSFHRFGETRSLYTGGIFRRVRNPISTGLAAVYAGFFFYLPSVTMGIGVVVFMLNCDFRVRMEEAYLERSFGDRYRLYRRTTGKYFPRTLS